MMRISRNSVLMLIGALAFFTVLAVAAPAALIAPQIKDAAPGISFHSIRGTVWRARVQGVQTDGVPIGNLRADFILHRLLTGNIAYRVTASGGAVNGGAIVSQSFFGRLQISNANINISRNLLRRYALLGVPVEGSVQIAGGRILMKGAGCIEAKGELQTNALSAVARQLGAGAIEMSGSLICADGNLMARLAGEQAETGKVTVELTQLDQFRYRMNVMIETDNNDLRQALQFAGFEVSGKALFYEEIANWTDPPRAAPVENQPDGGGA